MNFTIDSFEQFHKDNYKLLQQNLGQQLQEHFNLLVKVIPSVQSIEWTTEQLDDMVFHLIYFKVQKYNGYIFEHYSNSDTSHYLPSSEFNGEESELIFGFENYLDSLSHLFVTLWGEQSFQLK